MLRIYWEGGGDSETERSLLNYIEVHSEAIRSAYTGFIFDLGRTSMKQKPLASHFTVNGGYNVWWMSLLEEKSTYKSGRILDCLKLFALEEIIKKEKPAAVHLVAVERTAIGSVKELCLGFSVRLEIESVKEEKRSLFDRLKHNVLLGPVLGFIWLLRIAVSFRYIYQRKQAEWLSDGRSVFFMSYFVHLNSEKASRGEFSSGHWGPLPSILGNAGVGTNWLHHFFESELTPNAKTGHELLEKINQHNHTTSVHRFIESYISLPMIWKASSGFLSVIRKKVMLPGIRHAFRAKNSTVNLWPLLKQDWHLSTSGYIAMQNLLWIALFDVAMQTLPRQKLGFFLLEGQGWESGFIHAWRRHGHGKLVGVQHATIRHWDLRYFTEYDTKAGNGIPVKPVADLIGVNGEPSAEIYRSLGYNSENIIHLEALRYIDTPFVLAPEQSLNGSKKESINALVLGDYVQKDTEKMLECLNIVSGIFDKAIQWSLKPHPAFFVDGKRYPQLHFSQTNKPLSAILPLYDFVICAGGSTAGLDAFLAKKKVIVFRNPQALNMNPLRNESSVIFATDADGLVKAINQTIETSQSVSVSEFFWREADIPKWCNFLEKELGSG